MTTHNPQHKGEARTPETEALRNALENLHNVIETSELSDEDMQDIEEAFGNVYARAAELEQQAPLTSREQDAHDAKILAGPSFFTPEAISRQQAQPNNGMTHWEGCWREHHECAMAIIERSQAQPVAVTKDVLDKACTAYTAACGEAAWKDGLRAALVAAFDVAAPAQAQPPADGWQRDAEDAAKWRNFIEASSRYGSSAKGEKSSGAKLTEIQVVEILGRVKNGESRKSVAKHFNVTDVCIGDICKGRTWKHLAAPEAK